MKLKAENGRNLKQADYDVLKEGFKDPVLSKLKYMELIGNLYRNISIKGFNINHMGDGDPIAEIVGKFTEMAKIEEDQ